MAEITRHDNTLACRGSLTIQDAAATKTGLLEAIGGLPRESPPELDLSEAGPMDTAGFQLIAALAHSMPGGGFARITLSDSVAEFFERVGLSRDRLLVDTQAREATEPTREP